MSATYSKDRLEDIVVSVGFSTRLATGDSVASCDEVLITRPTLDTFEDASAEFGSPAGVVSGDDVQVELGAAASATDQPAGHYTVRVGVTTANGETLYGETSIEITDVGEVL